MRVTFTAAIEKADKGWVLNTTRENRKKKGEAKAKRFGLSTLAEVQEFISSEFKAHGEAEENHKAPAV